MIEEQEREHIIPNMPSMIPDPPGEDFFKFRIDGSDILEEVAHQLRGELYNPDTKRYEVKFDRWINDEGINKIVHIIYSCGVNKNIFLGNLDQEQILFRCRMIKKKLALLLFKNWKFFEVKREMRDFLITTVMNTIHSALSRSEGGKEAHQISVAAQRHEIFQHQTEDKKSNGVVNKLPGLGFFGRGR